MRTIALTSKSILFCLGLVLSNISLLPAQDVRVETQQQARARRETVASSETTTEEVSDPELGDIYLVSRAPRPKMFTLFTAQALNYTTNAFLVHDPEQSDFYWNGRVGASFIPYATRDFTPRLTFSQDWFRYDRFSDLDFDAQNLQLDVKYNLNHDDSWFVTGSYSVSRLYSPDDSIGEFYKYGFLNGSLTRLVQLRTVPLLLGFSGGSYWRTGEPSTSDRASLYLGLAAIYNINNTVQLSGFARPEYQHYTHDPAGTRDDFNLNVGTVLSWTPNQYLTLAATASYIGNFSSVGDRRYDVVSPSVILAGQIAF